MIHLESYGNGYRTMPGTVYASLVDLFKKTRVMNVFDADGTIYFEFV